MIRIPPLFFSRPNEKKFYQKESKILKLDTKHVEGIKLQLIELQFIKLQLLIYDSLK